MQPSTCDFEPKIGGRQPTGMKISDQFEASRNEHVLVPSVSLS
jgi:hypothetical protein